MEDSCPIAFGARGRRGQGRGMGEGPHRAENLIRVFLFDGRLIF
jgi:hypothetical protein